MAQYIRMSQKLFSKQGLNPLKSIFCQNKIAGAKLKSKVRENLKTEDR